VGVTDRGRGDAIPGGGEDDDHVAAGAGAEGGAQGHVRRAAQAGVRAGAGGWGSGRVVVAGAVPGAEEDVRAPHRGGGGPDRGQDGGAEAGRGLGGEGGQAVARGG